MAGDWLKIEVALPQKPEVWQMAGMLGIDPDSVVGKLLKVWAWFDAHTENGDAFGVTFVMVDSIAGRNGFGEAMALCGWLEQNGSLLRLPNFDRHNGKTAKNRALTAKRMASMRNKSDDESDAADVTSASAREEKRREDQKRMSSDKPPTDIDARLAQVTDEAVEAYNAFAEPLGLAKALPVGMDKKRGYVRRSLKTIREICRVAYGAERIEPQFWADYFAAQAADDFIAGRTGRTKDHANWRPDFEYLTRPDVIAKAFERAAA